MKTIKKKYGMRIDRETKKENDRWLHHKEKIKQLNSMNIPDDVDLYTARFLKRIGRIQSTMLY
jgi:hypothetical protein